jgi:hypothetical protein
MNWFWAAFFYLGAAAFAGDRAVVAMRAGWPLVGHGRIGECA